MKGGHKDMANTIIIMGAAVQGLIAAAYLARDGHTVEIVDFGNELYADFADGHKTGPVTHIPFFLSQTVIRDLDLETHGFDLPVPSVANPFKALPFYDGLKHLLAAFQSLDDNKPAYREKAWRDAWGTFELGRILSTYDESVQSLFAKSTTLSLVELLAATGLDEGRQAHILTACLCGSRTDPQAQGSAAAILPAMMAYEGDGVIVEGALHPLLKSLKNAAMGFGANIRDGQNVRLIETGDDGVMQITLDDDDCIKADYYILDHDPVAVFNRYMDAASLPPAFRNRVADGQNLKEAAHIRVALPRLPDGLAGTRYVAPSVSYVTDARHDLKKDGGSQLPVLSLVNITQSCPHFAPDGHIVLDILAHYFDPALDTEELTHEAQILVTLQALDAACPGIADTVIHSAIRPMNSQAGLPGFHASMPLLQLFRIFFGHHAIGYDVPHHNLLIAGYGAEACAHPHIRDGGIRVATLLQSLRNDDT